MKDKVVFTGSLSDAIKAIREEEAGVRQPEPVSAKDILQAGQDNPQSFSGSSGQEAPPSPEDSSSTELSKNSGRRRGNKNALMHGVYSSDLLLPWESEEDLLKLHEALREEYQPEGCSEEQAVLTLTSLMWIQRRVNNMALLQFQAGMPDACDSTPWQNIVAYQRETPAEIEKMSESAKTTLDALRTLTEKIRDESFAASTSTTEGKQTQQALSELRADVDRLRDQFEKSTMVAVKSLSLAAEYRLKVFCQAYQPDEIERLVAIMAAIDARIEKALWRLTAIKEFKKVRAPSLIPSQRPARAGRLPKKEVTAKADVQIESVAADDKTSDKK